MHIAHARTGMEIIPRAECLRLLADQKVGRLGFVVDGQPMVVPVNYGLHGDVILFRTGEGSKLEAVPGAKVAFEVDQIDDQLSTGWSVVVQGTAEEITEDEDWFAELLRRGAAPTWLPAPVGHYVRIKPTLISGRRLPSNVPHAPGPPPA